MSISYLEICVWCLCKQATHKIHYTPNWNLNIVDKFHRCTGLLDITYSLMSLIQRIPDPVSGDVSEVGGGGMFVLVLFENLSAIWWQISEHVSEYDRKNFIVKFRIEKRGKRVLVAFPNTVCRCLSNEFAWFLVFICINFQLYSLGRVIVVSVGQHRDSIQHSPHRLCIFMQKRNNYGQFKLMELDVPSKWMFIVFRMHRCWLKCVCRQWLIVSRCFIVSSEW